MKKLILVALLASFAPGTGFGTESSGRAPTLPRCNCYGPRAVIHEKYAKGCWRRFEAGREVLYRQGCTVSSGTGPEGGECEAWDFRAKDGKSFTVNGLIGEVQVSDPKSQCELIHDGGPPKDFQDWRKKDPKKKPQGL